MKKKLLVQSINKKFQFEGAFKEGMDTYFGQKGYRLKQTLHPYKALKKVWNLLPRATGT